MRKTFKFMALLAMGAALAFAACGKDDDNAQGGRYTLTVQPNNVDWGVATGSGSYPDGTSVTVEAAANLGYYFIKWSDGAVSNPRNITVSRDMTLYALFSATPNDPNPYNPGDGPAPEPEPEPDPEPTVGWVDLGLPSGLLWAKCNLGATTPEGHGDYYAWGETATKEVYNWSTYKYCTVDAEGELATLTKYNTSSGYGTPDNLTTLEAMDDAATQKLGDGARMPTADEWRELIANTTAEWTQVNGVNGRKFTAPNGKSLFLPAAGYRWDGELYDAGEYGDYWSSSLGADGPDGAWYFGFSSGGQNMYYDTRYDGQSVRAVRSQN
ncbi:MAG: hypothetical protein SPL12_07335 [Bacteroidales bacterium]|nr:hypothetical protein [Bacteroidales bacterium]